MTNDPIRNEGSTSWWDPFYFRVESGPTKLADKPDPSLVQALHLRGSELLRFGDEQQKTVGASLLQWVEAQGGYEGELAASELCKGGAESKRGCSGVERVVGGATQVMQNLDVGDVALLAGVGLLGQATRNGVMSWMGRRVESWWNRGTVGTVLARGVGVTTEVAGITGIGVAEKLKHGESVNLGDEALRTGVGWLGLRLGMLGVGGTAQAFHYVGRYEVPRLVGGMTFTRVTSAFVGGTAGMVGAETLFESSDGLSKRALSQKVYQAATTQAKFMVGMRGIHALFPSVAHASQRLSVAHVYLQRGIQPKTITPPNGFDRFLGTLSSYGAWQPAMAFPGRVEGPLKGMQFGALVEPALGAGRGGANRRVKVDESRPPMGVVPFFGTRFEKTPTQFQVPNPEAIASCLAADPTYAAQLLGHFGLTTHALDIRAFARGFNLARQNPETVRTTAWDLDEVQLHWALTPAGLLRGNGRGQDARYHHTDPKVFDPQTYQPYQPRHKPNPLLRAVYWAMDGFRLRQEMQLHPGVPAYELGLRLGQADNLILCTTGPSGRFMILANEVPALKYIYFGKGPDELVTDRDVRHAPNIYTREHLAMAMQQAASLRYLADEHPLVVDYVHRVQNNPKGGAKLKHPALPLLLAKAGIAKRPFNRLVDDSSSTYKMLAALPGFTIYQPPSNRKKFSLWPLSFLNLTLGTSSGYLNRMSGYYVDDLANAMGNGYQSVRLPRTAPIPADYPHQRLAIELPWWRHDREYFGPMRDIKADARAVRAAHLPPTFKNRYVAMRHGLARSNSYDQVVSDPARASLPKWGLEPESRTHMRESFNKWFDSNQPQIEAALQAGKLHIFSSDFSRARETAEIAAAVIYEKTGKHIAIQIAPALRDRGFGGAEGQSPAATYYNQVWAEDPKNPHHKMFGAESAHEVQGRFVTFMKGLEKRFSDGDHLVLLFSHGDLMRIGMTAVNDMNPGLHVERFGYIFNGDPIDMRRQPNIVQAPTKLNNQFVAVRHGQAVPNVEKHLVSSPKIGMEPGQGLTATGRIQTRERTLAWYDANQARIDEALAAGKLHIYASPFTRTTETAQLAADVLYEKTGKRVHVVRADELRERYFGERDGSNDPWSVYRAVWAEDKTNPHHHYQQAENPYQVQARFLGFMNELDRRYADGDHLVLLYSHGDVIRLSVAGLTRSPSYDPAVHKESFGDVHHVEYRELTAMESPPVGSRFQYRLMNSTDYQEMPWASGKGVTHQVAINPPNADMKAKDFAWRVSMAPVKDEGAWSHFTGYQRVVVITEGPGIVLTHHMDDALPVTNRVLPWQVYRFDGTATTKPELIGGIPIKDFSVIYDPTRARVNVSVLDGTNGSVDKGALRALTQGDHYYHCAQGPCTIAIKGEAEHHLNQGDTFHLQVQPNNAVQITVRPGSSTAKVISTSIYPR
ncbi:MAG: HutD family protein [Deltaproteobacteria bacterium]|nr:HutD family protein [Deltaproteobacteria bacterium]